MEVHFSPELFHSGDGFTIILNSDNKERVQILMVQDFQFAKHSSCVLPSHSNLQTKDNKSHHKRLQLLNECELPKKPCVISTIVAFWVENMRRDPILSVWSSCCVHQHVSCGVLLQSFTSSNKIVKKKNTTEIRSETTAGNATSWPDVCLKYADDKL